MIASSAAKANEVEGGPFGTETTQDAQVAGGYGLDPAAGLGGFEGLNTPLSGGGKGPRQHQQHGKGAVGSGKRNKSRLDVYGRKPVSDTEDLGKLVNIVSIYRMPANSSSYK